MSRKSITKPILKVKLDDGEWMIFDKIAPLNVTNDIIYGVSNINETNLQNIKNNGAFHIILSTKE